MRVLLLLSSASVTGPAEICLTDAEALRAVGHAVAFGCDTRRPGDYAAAIERAGFPLCRDLALCPSPTPAEIVRDVTRLRARFRRREFDLVHARFPHDHAIALLAAQRLPGRPRVVRTLETARAMRRGALRTWALRRIDGVAVAAVSDADAVAREHRLDRARVEAIPGRVDPERFAPGDAAPFRAHIAAEPGEIVVGIVSRIKHDRRHLDVLRGFGRAAWGDRGALLAVVGRGEGEAAVRAEAARLGLCGRVRFAGYRAGDALVEAYRGLDVAVWLAEGNDGTCRAVLEAMACGKPVVGARHGAIAELVEDRRTGILVPPGDLAALAEGLSALGHDPALRARMGEAGRRRVVERFTPPMRAERLLAFYDRVAALSPVG